MASARVSTVYAWLFASHQLGAASAAVLAGTVREWRGSYGASFVGAGLLCLIASGLVLQIGQRPRRRAVEAVTPTLS